MSHRELVNDFSHPFWIVMLLASLINFRNEWKEVAYLARFSMAQEEAMRS